MKIEAGRGGGAAIGMRGGSEFRSASMLKPVNKMSLMPGPDILSPRDKPALRDPFAKNFMKMVITSREHTKIALSSERSSPQQTARKFEGVTLGLSSVDKQALLARSKQQTNHEISPRPRVKFEPITIGLSAADKQAIIARKLQETTQNVQPRTPLKFEPVTIGLSNTDKQAILARTQQRNIFPTEVPQPEKKHTRIIEIRQELAKLIPQEKAVAAVQQRIFLRQGTAMEKTRQVSIEQVRSELQVILSQTEQAETNIDSKKYTKRSIPMIQVEALPELPKDAQKLRERVNSLIKTHGTVYAEKVLQHNGIETSLHVIIETSPVATSIQVETRTKVVSSSALKEEKKPTKLLPQNIPEKKPEVYFFEDTAAKKARENIIIQAGSDTFANKKPDESASGNEYVQHMPVAPPKPAISALMKSMGLSWDGSYGRLRQEMGKLGKLENVRLAIYFALLINWTISPVRKALEGSGKLVGRKEVKLVKFKPKEQERAAA